MKDYFAVLEMERSPFINPSELKETFQKHAAASHPDLTGNSDRFTEVTQAWGTLRDPVSCLRHWLDLSVPGFVPQKAPPPDLFDLFSDISAIEERTRNFRSKKETARSSVTLAMLESERLALENQRTSLLSKL